MKKLIALFLVVNLFAFEGAAVKAVSKLVSKDAAEVAAKKYGKDGALALERLYAKYGDKAAQRLDKISLLYGREGVNLVAKYGEDAVKNKTVFEIVKKFKDKGYYLIKTFPQKSVEYYKKFGDKFVQLSEKYGPSRMIKYLNGAEKYNAGDKIIKFLDKFGEKANEFLDRHWGKLLTSGFVLLNAESLIKSTENIAKSAITTGGETVAKTVPEVAKETFDSKFGIFAGIVLILFVIFKFGWEFILRLRKDN